MHRYLKLLTFMSAAIFILLSCRNSSLPVSKVSTINVENDTCLLPKDTVTPQGGFIRYKKICRDSFRLLYGKQGFLDSMRMSFPCKIHPYYHLGCQYEDNIVLYQYVGGELLWATVLSLKRADSIRVYQYLVDIYSDYGFILAYDPIDKIVTLLDLHTDLEYTKEINLQCFKNFENCILGKSFNKNTFIIKYKKNDGTKDTIKWLINR